MGIPQRSILAPILFNILLSDLPKWISKKINLVQYVDDNIINLAIWMNVSLRTKTPKKNVTYFPGIYQAEIDNFNIFMKEMG